MKISSKIHGAECFFSIDGDKGYKVYRDMYKRNLAWKQQTLAAKHGLGPEVYGRGNIVINRVVHWYYITEVVELLDKNYYKNGRINDIDMDQETYDLYISSIQTVEKELREIGILESTIDDLHSGNLGIKNGKVIAIDFGAGT